MDLTEAEKILRSTHCPKCGLSADTLLHRLCTHKECPVRTALTIRMMNNISDDDYKPGSRH